MTSPTQDRAGRYLKEVMETIEDNPRSEKAIKTLLRCSELADQDWAECHTNQQKQKVWAALLSSVQLLIRSRGGKAIATNALREALGNTSLGRPGDHGLTGPTTSNTKTIDREWMRACTIALIDAYPNNRQKIYKEAAHILGVSEHGVKKMRENYQGGKIGADVLKNLVGTAKKIIKEFGYEKLSDILPTKPPPRA
ncbi:MAG: hypothetical protein QGI29_04645 [Pirellulales bacterium]|jgi:hypothetical protein|nr:hypothetical protein [Pirellulales bacterium]MDP6736694.1 hypothetical protein [Nitrospinaceae bacterium]|tara:strand:- start:228 stop:815 length:588 start_codon:yes stop_codon:yes gene_type:complete